MSFRRTIRSKRREEKKALDLVVFSLGGYHFALESTAVREYLTNTKVEPLPESKMEHIIGILHLRGEYHSVIDLSKQLELLEKPINWKVKEGKFQKILVLNQPNDDNKTSRVALLVEDLTLLFQVNPTKIVTELPGVLINSSTKPAKIFKNQDITVNLLKGLLYDKDLGLIFLLDENFIHTFIDIPKPPKIDPLTTIKQTLRSNKTKDMDILKKLLKLKTSTRQGPLEEYLIGSSKGLILAFSLEKIKILGLKDEFILLQKDEIDWIALPKNQFFSEAVLFGNQLYPLITSQQLFTAILPLLPKKEEKVPTDTKSKKNKKSKDNEPKHDSVIFLYEDESSSQKFAIALDDFIDISSIWKKISVKNPTLYPHLKNYFPIIEDICVFNPKNANLGEKFGIKINLDALSNRIHSILTEIDTEFSWTKLQIPAEKIPAITTKISNIENVFHLKELMVSNVNENFIVFDLTPQIGLSIPTNKTKGAESLTKFDVKDITNILSTKTSLTINDDENQKQITLINPYQGQSMERLLDATDQSDYSDENEELIDNLDVIFLSTVPSTDADEIGIICYNPQPLLAINNLEFISKEELHPSPEEELQFPIIGELKFIFKKDVQKRTFVLDVDKFVQNFL